MRPDSITLAVFEKYTPEELTTTAIADGPSPSRNGVRRGREEDQRRRI